MHSTETRFVIGLDWKLYCSQPCVCTLFSLEILQAGAVKGLKYAQEFVFMTLAASVTDQDEIYTTAHLFWF